VWRLCARQQYPTRCALQQTDAGPLLNACAPLVAALPVRCVPCCQPNVLVVSPLLTASCACARACACVCAHVHGLRARRDALSAHVHEGADTLSSSLLKGTVAEEPRKKAVTVSRQGACTRMCVCVCVCARVCVFFAAVSVRPWRCWLRHTVRAGQMSLVIAAQHDTHTNPLGRPTHHHHHHTHTHTCTHTHTHATGD
jgi:hypothetical protein